MLTAGDRPALADLAPLLRRAGELEPHGIARLQLAGPATTASAATVWVRLPFGVLVSRTIDTSPRSEPLDLVTGTREILDWLDGDGGCAPAARDAEWRVGLPPTSGWRRIETIPDEAIRTVVRSGARTLQQVAVAGGPSPAQPRSDIADALLDTVVLTVDDATGLRAEVTLRTLSALTRMGFLHRGGVAHVDTAGRWIRVVAEYGAVYLERAGHSLRMR